jgi:putative ABC transport system permease protein
VVLALNDLTARPLRTLLTGLSLLMGVLGIIFGWVLTDTIEFYRYHPELLGLVYDAMVTSDTLTANQIERRLQRAPGVTGFYREQTVKVKTADGISFRVHAVEGDLAVFPFPIMAGRFFRPQTNEAIAGRGLLDWLGLQVGDTLTVQVVDGNSRTITWQIVGEYLEPANNGQMLMVNLASLRQAAPAIGAAYYLKLDPQADPLQLKQYLAPSADSNISLVMTGEAIPDSVRYLQVAIFALAAIVVGVALVNVFNMALQATREKMRLLGILKAVGMAPAQVVWMLCLSMGCLGLGVTLVGVPLGWWGTWLLLTYLARTYGFAAELPLVFNGWYGILVPGMLVLSMAGSLLPAWQAARAPIVPVLRGE